MSRLTRLKTLTFITLLCISLGLSGCWDNREIEQMAIISTLGVDLLPNGEWQVSVLLVNPFTGGPEGSANQKIQDTLMKGTGRTLEEAVNNFIKRVSRVDFFGSLESLIIGERAAQKHVLSILEYHLRNPETRPRTTVSVTRGEAYEILQAEPDIAPSLSREIKLLSELTIERFGTSYGTNVVAIAQAMLAPDRDAVISEIRMMTPEERKSEDNSPTRSIYLEGVAVFRGTELAGWLDRDETVAYLIATKRLNRGRIPVLVEMNGQTITFNLMRARSKITPHVEGDNISYTLNVKVEGTVYDSEGIPMTTDHIIAIEKLVSDKLVSDLLKIIQKSKEYNSDFMGFSMNLHRKNPDTWKKIKAHWRESYRQAAITVHVETTVRSTGFFGETFFVEK